MELYDDAADVPQVDPSKVTQISRLLYFLMSSLISDSREQFIINQKKLHQQARSASPSRCTRTMEPVQDRPLSPGKGTGAADQGKGGEPERVQRPLKRPAGIRVFIGRQQPGHCQIPLGGAVLPAFQGCHRKTAPPPAIFSASTTSSWSMWTPTAPPRSCATP